MVFERVTMVFRRLSMVFGRVIESASFTIFGKLQNWVFSFVFAFILMVVGCLSFVSSKMHQYCKQYTDSPWVFLVLVYFVIFLHLLACIGELRRQDGQKEVTIQNPTYVYKTLRTLFLMALLRLFIDMGDLFGQGENADLPASVLFFSLFLLTIPVSHLGFIEYDYGLGDGVFGIFVTILYHTYASQTYYSQFALWIVSSLLYNFSYAKYSAEKHLAFRERENAIRVAREAAEEELRRKRAIELEDQRKRALAQRKNKSHNRRNRH